MPLLALMSSNLIWIPVIHIITMTRYYNTGSRQRVCDKLSLQRIFYEAEFRVSRNEYAAFAAFSAVSSYYHGAPSRGSEFDFIELCGDYYSRGRPGSDNNTRDWPNGGAFVVAHLFYGLAPGGV